MQVYGPPVTLMPGNNLFPEKIRLNGGLKNGEKQLEKVCL